METNEIKKRGLKKGTVLKRSNAYPSITLIKAVEITEAVYKNAGNSYLTLENIGKLIKRNPNSITQWLGSCVQYGLLEMKSKVGYKSSDICKRIFKPINETEKKEALIECFKKPKLYQEIVAKYQNSSIPSLSVLPNILDRDHSIFDDAAIKASQILFENLSDLGILNDDNEIEFDSKLSNSNDEKIEDINELDNDEKDNEFPTHSKVLEKNNLQSNFNLDILKTEIPLTENKLATLFYPKNINDNDIKILKAQIDLISLYINLNTSENDKI